MIRAILVAVVLSCLVVSEAVAGYVDGNQLFSDCEGRPEGRGQPNSQLFGSLRLRVTPIALGAFVKIRITLVLGGHR